MNTTDRQLPELADARVDRIEDEVFAGIARGRADDRARRARRGRVWMAGGAAAAIIAVAAIIAPAVGGLVSATDEAGSADAPATNGGVDVQGGTVELDGSKTVESAESGAGAADAAGQAVAGQRDIITTASATVVVPDTTRAAREVGEAAAARGGYVESMNVGTTGGAVPVDPASGLDAMSYPYPYPLEGAWVTVRVPEDALTAMMDDLAEFGEVSASSVSRQDVTTQTIDLEASIASAQTSVDRLTQLMGEATSVADLIAAESALSERQAALESSQQQLAMLADQVAMSSLTVTLTPEVETVEADAAGFADGVAAGWNGLVASFNAVVTAVGFLLPWLGVLGLLVLVVWGIRRAVKGSRSRRADAASPADPLP